MDWTNRLYGNLNRDEDGLGRSLYWFEARHASEAKKIATRVRSIDGIQPTTLAARHDLYSTDGVLHP